MPVIIKKSPVNKSQDAALIGNQLKTTAKAESIRYRGTIKIKRRPVYFMFTITSSEKAKICNKAEATEIKKNCQIKENAIFVRPKKLPSTT